jgi:CDGSH-type Zn-finger protein
MSTESNRVVITIKPSGSISIEGEVVLQDRDGNLIPRPPEKRPGILKLCGCGHSRTPPFCDGTHNEIKK